VRKKQSEGIVEPRVAVDEDVAGHGLSVRRRPYGRPA
jgi:hypothetical protein